MPFTDFSSAGHTARLLFRPSTLRSAIEIDGDRRIEFPRTGVALKLVDLGADRFAVFFCEIYSNRLFLYEAGPRGLNERYLRGGSRAELMFREAVVHDGALVAVLYDSDLRQNQLVTLDPSGDGDVTVVPDAILPSIQDPGGATYEQNASVFLLPTRDVLWVVAGTLVQAIGEGGPATEQRLAGCLRAQEAVLSPAGEPVILCVAQEDQSSAFKLIEVRDGIPQARPIETNALVMNLRPNGEYDTVRDADGVARALRADLMRNHGSGVMELGSNNVEGRVPWSQIYFLNGLMDLVLTARADAQSADRFGPLVADAKRRIDIEMYVLNRLLSDRDFLTEGFTVNRAPVLYAVQTSRLLLLFNRYARELRNGARLSTHQELADLTLTLRGHIDVVTTESPQMRADRPYLYWPRGSAAYFDGLNVPYNHQNEWAYAVTDTLSGRTRITAEDRDARDASIAMVDTFLDEVAPQGTMPQSGEWPYWWGRARNPWTEADDVSVNTRAYRGDTLVSFISFRTIDVMSVLAVKGAEPLGASIETLIRTGKVYPFAAASFVKYGFIPRIEQRVALHYARASAPWDTQSAVWALASLDLPAP